MAVFLDSLALETTRGGENHGDSVSYQSFLSPLSDRQYRVQAKIEDKLVFGLMVIILLTNSNLQVQSLRDCASSQRQKEETLFEDVEVH